MCLNDKRHKDSFHQVTLLVVHIMHEMHYVMFMI